MKGNSLYQVSAALLESLYDEYMETEEKKKVYEEYIKVLRKAAYAGHGLAQFELGQQYEDIYYFGVNVNCSPRKSFYWYVKACENNIGCACNILATYFERGLACEKDKEKALLLYEKASLLGDKLAKKNYKLLQKELSRISKAQQTK